MLLYLIVDYLYDISLVLEDFFNWSSTPPIIKRLNSHSMCSSFGWSTMKKISEDPVLSVGPFQTVQLEVIYFYVVRENKKQP